MKNQTGRYFKYAVGEILLVVIGILIALQINNWNETKKERAYEIKMLSEISESLKKDIDEKRYVFNFFQNTEHSVNELLKMKENRNYSRDSVLNHLDRISELGLFFPYSNGAFDALKSSGLDKISNDTIRENLVYLYSYTFPSISIFVNELARPTMNKKFELFDKVFPSTMNSGQDGIPQKQYSYENFEEILHTDDFDELLRLSHYTVESITPRLKSLVRRMEKMKYQIDREIN